MKQIYDSKESELFSTNVEKQFEEFNMFSNETLGVASKGYTLEDLLSADTSVKIEYSALTDYSQEKSATLAIDTANIFAQVLYGSAVKYINFIIDDIKNKFPFGVRLSSASSAETIGTTYYLHLPSTNVSFYYSGVNIYSGSVFENKFNISPESGLSGFPIISWSACQTANTITIGINTTHVLFNSYTGSSMIVYPNDSKLYSFETTLFGYGRDLYFRVSPHINVWPKDNINKNILVGGSLFNSFKEHEIEIADQIDDKFSNIFYRLAVPGAMKLFDTDDEVIKELSELFGFIFDDVKRYIDQIKFAYSMSLRKFNNVAKEFIGNLANNYGIDLLYSINKEPLSKHFYKYLNNYSSGYLGTEAHLSIDDVVYEYYRRILMNRPLLEKKKGTRRVLEILRNIIGVPEGLLLIREYIKHTIGINKSDTSTTWDNNRIYTSSTNNIIGDRKLDVFISPADCINTDYYNWGNQFHNLFININNKSFDGLSGTNYEQQNWEKLLFTNTIPSNENRRRSSGYTILESLHNYYLNDSLNKITMKMLENLIDFIESLYPHIIKKMIPMSTKATIGNILYKNTIWHRPKHEWKKEIKYKPYQMVDSDSSLKFSLYNVIKELQTKKQTSISVKPNINSIKKNSLYQNNNLNICSILNKKQSYTCGTNIKYNANNLYFKTNSGIYDNKYSYSGLSYSFDIPNLVETNTVGTQNYYDFNQNAIIMSEKNSILLQFSGNPSSWEENSTGYVSIKLYKLLDIKEKSNYENKQYQILKVIKEDNNYGLYNVDSTINLNIGELVNVNLNEFSINKQSKILFIDQKRRNIQLYPPLNIVNSSYNFNREKIINDINLTNVYPKIKINRIMPLFNWNSPNLNLMFSGSSSSTNNGQWIFSGGYIISGQCLLSGYNLQNERILLDKNEYFWSYEVYKTIDQIYSAALPSDYFIKNVPVIKKFKKETTLSGFTNYGNYFMFLDKPNIPAIINSPTADEILKTNIFNVKFNGVGDADKFRLEFIQIPYEPISEDVTGFTTGMEIVKFADNFEKENDNWDYIYGNESLISFPRNIQQYGSKCMKIVPRGSGQIGNDYAMVHKSLKSSLTNTASTRFYINTYNHIRNVNYSGSQINICEMSRYWPNQLGGSASAHCVVQLAYSGQNAWGTRILVYSGQNQITASTSWILLPSGDTYNCIEMLHSTASTKLYLNDILTGTVTCINSALTRSIRIGLYGISGGSNQIDSGYSLFDSVVFNDEYIGSNNINLSDDGVFTGSLVSTGITLFSEFNIDEIGIKDDSYYYQKMVSLLPNTWYWWRLKNLRGKVNIFGNSLYGFSATEPKRFKTGNITNQSEGGENLIEYNLGVSSPLYKNITETTK